MAKCDRLLIGRREGERVILRVRDLCNGQSGIVALAEALRGPIALDARSSWSRCRTSQGKIRPVPRSPEFGRSVTTGQPVSTRTLIGVAHRHA